MDLESIFYSKLNIVCIGCIVGIFASTACSSVKSILSIESKEKPKPISNPFEDYQTGRRDENQTMILRTKKGDRSVELQIPGDPDKLSDFVIPVSPAFKETTRAPASTNEPDLVYQAHHPTQSDREITESFKQNTLEDQSKRQEIEQGLHLTSPDDQANDSERDESKNSYLSKLDFIKELYKRARYEAALLETDELLVLYPTDPKLHEMRGTLFERLGQHELAVKSWNQSLRLNPSNPGLRKYIERKPSKTGSEKPT